MAQQLGWSCMAVMAEKLKANQSQHLYLQGEQLQLASAVKHCQEWQQQQLVRVPLAATEGKGGLEGYQWKLSQDLA